MEKSQIKVNFLLKELSTPALVLHVLHLKEISFKTMGVGGRSRGRFRRANVRGESVGRGWWGIVALAVPAIDLLPPWF